MFGSRELKNQATVLLTVFDIRRIRTGVKQAWMVKLDGEKKFLSAIELWWRTSDKFGGICRSPPISFN